MNRIITIGREFGSGGRELGKRIAENLGVAYYDGEIVTAIAEKSELAVDYVNQILEKRIRAYYPITVGHSLSAAAGDALCSVTQSVYAAQTEVLREMAQKSDCVIVGRCADKVLEDLKPLRIFVYADMEARIARCRAMGEHGDAKDDKALARRIREVDKARAQYYHFYTGRPWADRHNYDLLVNTSGIQIAALAKLICAKVRCR